MTIFKEGDKVEILNTEELSDEYKGEKYATYLKDLFSDSGRIKMEDWDTQLISKEFLKLTSPKFKVGDTVRNLMFGDEIETVHSIIDNEVFVAVDEDWNYSCEEFSGYKKVEKQICVGGIVVNPYWREYEVLQILGEDNYRKNNLLVKNDDGFFVVVDGDKVTIKK